MDAAQGTPLDFLRALPTVAPLAAADGFVAGYLEAVLQLDEAGPAGTLALWAQSR
jgi:hypothetical protein